MSSANSKVLLRQLDHLIAKHGSGDLSLLQDLQTFRTELVAANMRGPTDYALIALRISTWIKFILDHLPPPH